MSAKKTPTPSQISAVMSALGSRPKRNTLAGRRQRRLAGIASGAARRAAARAARDQDPGGATSTFSKTEKKGTLTSTKI